MAATSGLANALFMDPSAGQREFNEALVLFEELLEFVRSRGDTRALGSILNNCATALRVAPAGDPVRRIEQALAYALEAVDVFAQGRGTAEWNALGWGRAQYTLAGIYWERQRGLRGQNVHLAVTALQEALTVRTVEADPVGRVKTLRALSLMYPTWMGAETRTHGQWLADAARAAAEEIEHHDPRVAGRMVGWARYAGEASMLKANLDWVDRMHPDTPVAWLEGVIAHHREALEAIPREQMPSWWAEWMGALGRLLGLLARVRPECLAEAVACFDHAIGIDGIADQPRLRRALFSRMGIMGHEFASWDIALRGSAGALNASDELFAASGSVESRELEIETSNELSFIAAHAAARLGRLEDAVRYAERGRSRTLVDAAAAEEAALASVSTALRAEVTDARAHVRRLESELATLESGGDMAEAIRGSRRLAAFFEVDPEMFHTRILQGTAAGHDEHSAEYSRISAELHDARAKLRQAVTRAGGADARFGPILEWQHVRDVAACAGYPIVYLIPSTYGSVAVIVAPDAAPEALFLDRITSDDT
ncbi:MAG TPA: hypothetical protein VF701_02080, partial [Thermoanaerobaculia bacterium]